MNKKPYFKNHQRVVLHSLGPFYAGEEFPGEIVGLSVDDMVRIYIVKLDKFSEVFMSYDGIQYDCVTITEACIRAI